MPQKIMISLSGRNQAWFDRLSKRDQKEYLKAHPKSKFGPGAKTTTKTKATQATKPVAKKVASKAPAKTSAKKKATSVKSVQRKSKPSAKQVHPEVDKLHEHALKQKKDAIDKLVAPYAKALRILRNKRDAGEGLTNDESKRYKQLLVTIAHLHKGR